MTSNLKILLVDDDALIGADLRQTLTGFGYTVVGPIDNGEEVLTRLGEISPDVILMDIKLKGKLDGIQTAEEVQQRQALPIVFLTGLTDEQSFQRAKLVNPYGYLIKPFDGPELRSTIELTLHRFNNRDKRADNEVMQHEAHGELSDTPLMINAETANEKGAILSYFSQLSLFRDVPPDAIEALAKNCSLRRFDAGEFVVMGDDSSRAGFIPVSGRISIMKTSDSGKELIVALLAPGDVLGLQFSIKSFATALSARTQIPSRVIWVPAAKWEYLLERWPTLSRTLSTLLTTHLIRSFDLASSLAHASVEGRIINTLVALLPQFGRAIPDAENVGRIFITRKELAELTGTTPETAYRVTKHLEREKMLDLTRPGILKIINVSGLRDFASKQ